MAPDPMAAFREREEESIFAPIPKVPNSKVKEDISKQSVNSIISTRMQDLWPKNSDPFPLVLKKMWSTIEPYSWKEVWALEFNFKALAVMNTLSSFYIGGVFRRAVNLTGAGFSAVNVLMPSIFGSTIFGAFFHTQTVLSPMCTNIGGDHRAQVVESAAIHMITSFWYPLIFTSVSAVYFASRTHTFPVPDDLVQSATSRKYIVDKIFRPTLLKNRNGLIATALVNTVGIIALTAMESRQLKTVHADLVAKVRQEAQSGHVQQRKVLFQAGEQ